jgi:hypothetical protein
MTGVPLGSEVDPSTGGELVLEAALGLQRSGDSTVSCEDDNGNAVSCTWMVGGWEGEMSAARWSQCTRSQVGVEVYG